MYMSMLQCIIEQSPCFFAFSFLHSLLLPIRLPLLTWNPPCCDRIRPPRSQVARKLIFPFPSPCPYTPHSKIPTPRSFPDPNIHSLGRHEPGSQDPAQCLGRYFTYCPILPSILFHQALFYLLLYLTNP